jgi:hypothetical protein
MESSEVTDPDADVPIEDRSVATDSDEDGDRDSLSDDLSDD